MCTCNHKEYIATKLDPNHECPCNDTRFDDHESINAFEAITCGLIGFDIFLTFFSFIFAVLTDYLIPTPEVDARTGTTAWERYFDIIGTIWLLSFIAIAISDVFYGLWLWDRSCVLANFDRLGEDEEIMGKRIPTRKSAESILLTVLVMFYGCAPPITYLAYDSTFENDKLEDHNLVLVFCSIFSLLFLAVGLATRVANHCGYSNILDPANNRIDSLVCRTHRLLQRNLLSGKGRSQILEVYDWYFEEAVDTAAELKISDLVLLQSIPDNDIEAEESQCQNKQVGKHYAVLREILATRRTIWRESEKMVEDMEPGSDKEEAEKCLFEE